MEPQNDSIGAVVAVADGAHGAEQPEPPNVLGEAPPLEPGLTAVVAVDHRLEGGPSVGCHRQRVVRSTSPSASRMTARPCGWRMPTATR
jgi:hypothetical protein